MSNDEILNNDPPRSRSVMLWIFVVIISVLALSLPFVIILAFIFGKDVLFKDNGDTDNIKYGFARPITARGNLAEDEKSTIEL